MKNTRAPDGANKLTICDEREQKTHELTILDFYWPKLLILDLIIFVDSRQYPNQQW